MAGRHGVGQWLGLLGPIDGRRGLAITRAVLTRFFDALIRDRTAFSANDITRVPRGESRLARAGTSVTVNDRAQPARRTGSGLIFSHESL
jgi:hypothetical protein